ncbi:MAG: hypothetical protein D3910_00185 [Candidatus Electrothrix sp. ATG2]|nr:hypothetical protein [Candidatus Electrothrix sp. ATG2]
MEMHHFNFKTKTGRKYYINRGGEYKKGTSMISKVKWKTEISCVPDYLSAFLSARSSVVGSLRRRTCGYSEV